MKVVAVETNRGRYYRVDSNGKTVLITRVRLIAERMVARAVE